jgi:hypothetical protein
VGRIVRELKSVSGAILGITILLIITFFVLNFIQSRAPAPISTGAGWAFTHATGSAYGAPAAPALAVSPYSANNNLGPLL